MRILFCLVFTMLILCMQRAELCLANDQPRERKSPTIPIRAFTMSGLNHPATIRKTTMRQLAQVLSEILADENESETIREDAINRLGSLCRESGDGQVHRMGIEALVEMAKKKRQTEQDFSGATNNGPNQTDVQLRTKAIDELFSILGIEIDQTNQSQPASANRVEIPR